MSYGYRVKRGVLLFLSPQIDAMLDVIGPVFEEHGVPLWLTSGAEGPHGPTSKHHRLMAFDVRSYYQSVNRQPTMRKVLQRCVEEATRLQVPMRIIPETDHWHVEWGD